MTDVNDLPESSGTGDETRSTPRWRVLKFGGSSVAEPANWTRIAERIDELAAAGTPCVVVVSALKGVTDRLVQALEAENVSSTDALVDELRNRHLRLAEGFGLDPARVGSVIDPELEALSEALDEQARSPAPAIEARVLATGELLSSRLGALILETLGRPVEWLDSRDLLVAEPASQRAARSNWLAAECAARPDPDTAAGLRERGTSWIAPGFIARNGAATVLLGRGGSDVSAALIGTVLEADRVEIFSDVPGLFSADPRRIPAARLLQNISYREAMELAAMGARALHPRALIPLKQHRIPLWLRQTDRPELTGTRITPDAHEHGAQVKAIVQRRGITLVTMEGLDMWQQVGFLADVFDVFRSHGLSVDLVSTSESNVTVTLDPGANPTDAATLERLAADLGRFCSVDVRTDCASVSLVGLGIRTILHRIGPALEVFEQRRIFLVSQASNDLNLSFVVEARHADRLVQQLHQQIIPGGVGGDSVFGPSWEQLVRDETAATARPPWWSVRADELLETLGESDAAYVYALAEVRGAARRLRDLKAVDRVLYSMKANPHPAILRALAGEGLGIECVSMAEADRALEAIDGLTAGDLLLTPNFAPRAEYREALERDVTVTIDNPWILEHWGEDFAGRDVFLRLDPGSGLGHHKMVRTAGSNAKFGVPLNELDRTLRLARAHDITIRGLHAHTGSGILHPDNWERTLETLMSVAMDLPSVEVINLGGGLGVPDRSDELPLDLMALDAGLARIKRGLNRPIEIWLEPGRYLVASAGVLLARVTQLKGKGEVRYVGVATGMNSLIRPALYGAWHEIVNLSRLGEPGQHVFNVVGPICETGDVLGLDRLLPDSREGDVLLIGNAGAYGAAMASRYNLREPAAERVLDVEPRARETGPADARFG
ncbi:bifunctional aspartate kinase/diaminopimelate decarboxylase [Halomonas denitrificans]|nr:bifunctional aspartate kinase/diaminopimelate decarboxylase [Halomonas denitrificans]